MHNIPLVFLDTETTGLSPTKDQIIEIGLLRVENDRVVATYQTLVKPSVFFSPYISTMTGIQPEELERAPEFADISRTLSDFLENAYLVGHNVRFDYVFLKNEFLRIGKKFSAKHLCTAKLSRTLFPTYRHHNLDSIIERFSLSVAKRHRAFDDAKALVDFYGVLQKTFPEVVLENAIKQVMKRPSLPRFLDEKAIVQLPESAGVYIFYDSDNVPLYVGKSINVKERVLSHFASVYKENKEMHLSRQVKNIEVIPTAGELGALLKESQLIKQLQPVYNRKLREARRLIIVEEITSSDGYLTAALKELTAIDPLATEHIITTCKSKMQAKEYLQRIKKEYYLCEKLLGLEKTKGACFSYRLGECKGACVGKEDFLSYNIRAIMAFSKNKIKPWPFSGPVVIKEKNGADCTVDHFLVDKWCLLGKKSSREFVEGEFSADDYRFDMDTYKILLSFLKKNISNAKSITAP